MKMRKSIHKFLALALAICMLVPMLAACEPEVDAATIISQYRLSSSSIDLSVGDVTGLTIFDESLSDARYDETWVSDNPAVVTASNGIVTAVGPGTATVKVTITREDIEPFDLSCVVTVTQDVVAVESIMLSSSTLTVLEGTSSVLSAVVLPTDATDKTIIWTSSDPAVATVSNGIVNGVAAGSAVITASVPDGSIAATCVVTVDPLLDDLTSFKISKSSASLYVGKTTTLKVTYEPESAGVSVVWTSSDPSVATVTDGVVKAIAAGKATITASYTDKVTTWEQTCVVTVSKQSASSDQGSTTPSTPSTPSTPTTVKATKVEFNKTSFYVNIGETTSWKIDATVTPANTTEKGTWTSSNPALVTVDSEGNAKVVATSLGENALETVTITYKVGSVQAAAVIVLQDKGDDEGSSTPTDPTPSEPSTPADPTPSTPSTSVDLVALAITQQSANVNVGESAVLTVTKSPANADETIVWTSADTTIATVDQNGIVTGIKAGSTVIYAKSSRTGMQAHSVVIVTAKNTNATAITLSQTNATLEAGSSLTLAASLVPATATETITWISSTPTVAVVDQNGKVTGVAMGTAVITATTSNGLSASCVVTVSAVTIKNITVSVKLSASGDLNNNKTYTATVQFSPALSAEDMADFYYDIYSDNTSVVYTLATDVTAMTNSFTVVPGEDGLANLYPFVGTSRSSFNFTYVPLSVSVNSPSADIETPVKSISLSVANGSTTMYAGDKLGLSVKVSPEIHDDTLTWSTSDSSVAIVENGVVTAVGPGVATITYKAKGNLTTNGISKSIKVTVQATASVNETLGRIMIMQGSAYQVDLSSLGTVLQLQTNSNIAGITVSSTGYIVVDESVAAGTSFQLMCGYLDAAGQWGQKTYNVIVQRAVSSSNTNAFAKYSITLEDGQEYDWSDFGLNFSGYTLVSTKEDDCSVDCDSNGVSADLEDDDKGSATIEVYDGETLMAKISVTVIEKDFIVELGKNSRVNIENELEDFLGVSSVNIIAITIDSKYEDYLEKDGDKYVKAQGKVGTAYVDVYYTVGGSTGSARITVEID